MASEVFNCELNKITDMFFISKAESDEEDTKNKEI